MKIKKVLNSSVVLVADGHGRERILLGKGIGYGRKPGAEVPAGATDQVFVALADPDQRNLVELLTQIPPDYIAITRDIVAMAEQAGLELDPHVYLTLTDHLHFAAERQRQGLLIVNRLAWEVRTLYPTQHAVAVKGLALTRERLGIELPDDEATNIAFHLINADTRSGAADSMRVVRLIGAILTIVTNTRSVTFDRQDLHFSRFVSHLQYFAERFYTDRLLSNDDDFLYTELSARYPRAMTTAEKIRAFIFKEHDTALPNEEVAYLALHIARAAPETNRKDEARTPATTPR